MNFLVAFNNLRSPAPPTTVLLRTANGTLINTTPAAAAAALAAAAQGQTNAGIGFNAASNATGATNANLAAFNAANLGYALNNQRYIRPTAQQLATNSAQQAIHQQQQAQQQLAANAAASNQLNLQNQLAALAALSGSPFNMTPSATSPATAVSSSPSTPSSAQQQLAAAVVAHQQQQQRQSASGLSNSATSASGNSFTLPAGYTLYDPASMFSTQLLSNSNNSTPQTAGLQNYAQYPQLTAAHANPAGIRYLTTSTAQPQTGINTSAPGSTTSQAQSTPQQ